MGEIEGWRGWSKAVLIAGIGGGLTGAFAAAVNPALYHFPRDFGSGKLWEFFFQGAGVTIGALLLKSPWGAKIVGQFKSTQTQLQADKATIAQAKADLKGPETKNLK